MRKKRLWPRRIRHTGERPSLDALLASVRRQPAADTALVERAYAEAAVWHRGHIRRSGDTVLAHCATVAAIVAECGMPSDVVCAALLHDLEDTACPPERVAELFGSYVADLVRAVPAAPLGPLSLDAPAAAPEVPNGVVPFEAAVLAIRLADRLHNMRTIAFVSQATRYRKARETVDVFAPLAQAAGLSQVSDELHDLASAVLKKPAASYALTGRMLAALTLLLPSRGRARWQEEWTAELAALHTRRARVRYTLRVLLHAPRLSMTLRRPMGQGQ
ncbi:HD domain-containing protein [Streptomyces sp. NPDC086554]|uniref:HD domain-containing protein n=1 Tax=Streptomyces sp. NPDC086554 TaxID=3154864 RepID=UPI003433BAA7